VGASPESIEKIKMIFKKIPKNKEGFIIFLLDFLFVDIGLALLIIGLLGNQNTLASIIKAFR
jgi:hypothetical protein